jgi:Tfp pilus assembly protein PilN
VVLCVSNLEQKKIILAQVEKCEEVWKKASYLSKEIEKEKKLYDGFLKKLGKFESLAKERSFWIGLLNDLNERMPEDVWITLLEVERKEGSDFRDAQKVMSVKLEGRVEIGDEDVDRVGEFRKILEESPYFSEVVSVSSDLKSHSENKVGLGFAFRVSLKKESKVE